MWETIKKDPVLKTIVVILIGILAFGFAFNVMFGAGNSGMEEGVMSAGAGYSLGNTLEFIIALLVKLVIIVLLIGVIVWLVQAVRKQLPGNGQSVNVQTSYYDWLKNDPIIRNSLIIIGVILVLGLMYSLFKGTAYAGNSETEMMGGSYYNPVNNFSFGAQSILLIFTKLLMLLSLIGLVFGLSMHIKESHLRSMANVKANNETVKNTSIICPECKSEIKTNWKCCPGCGSDKAFVKTNDNV